MLSIIIIFIITKILEAATKNNYFLGNFNFSYHWMILYNIQSGLDLSVYKHRFETKKKWNKMKEICFYTETEGKYETRT